MAPNRDSVADAPTEQNLARRYRLLDPSAAPAQGRIWIAVEVLARLERPTEPTALERIALFSLVLAGIAVFGGHALGGGSPGSLFQLTAFVIVIGGTISAVMLQTPYPVLRHGVSLVRLLLRPTQTSPEPLIERMIEYSRISRREGFLALEQRLEELDDPFQRKAMQLLIDGVEAAELRNVLDIELDTYEQHHRRAARIWEAAGAYAPTIGILGAVMGLIHVMEKLDSPGQLGNGIARAFVATLYGVGFANLLFIPLANRIKAWIANEVQLRRMLIEGFCAVATGDHPRLIERRMSGFANPI